MTYLTNTSSSETESFAFSKLRFSASGGRQIKKDGWDCFQWLVTLSNNGKQMVTPFYCGMAHVKKGRGIYTPDRPIKPVVKDVMYSLLLDANANNESFNNWCDSYGYDSDSLKALNMYQACCKTAEELSQLYSREELEAMRASLEDY